MYIAVWSWPMSVDSVVYAYIFPPILYPLNNISLCCSIYLIVCIAGERFDSKIKNTSLAAPGALAHRLQRRTACNTSPPTISKMADGVRE